MAKEQENREQQILDAAHKVFVEKGMFGARMQEIADKAGINKALLHYYFRSKEKLFHAIFKAIFKNFFGQVDLLLNSDKTPFEKLELFIDTYIDIIDKNPYIPQFIINEVTHNPALLEDIMRESGINPEMIFNLLEQSTPTNGNQNPIDSRHYVVSFMGMIIFPYAARPLLQRIYFGNDEKLYNNFLAERKQIIKSMIFKTLQK